MQWHQDERGRDCQTGARPQNFHPGMLADELEAAAGVRPSLRFRRSGGDVTANYPTALDTAAQEAAEDAWYAHDGTAGHAADASAEQRRQADAEAREALVAKLDTRAALTAGDIRLGLLLALGR